MTTDERLARLERENRWIKRMAGGAVVFAGLLTFGGAEPKEKTPKNIEAQRFTVVDEDGKRLAVFGRMGRDFGGGGTLLIFDPNDKTDVIVSRNGISAPGFTATDDEKKGK